MSVDVEVSGDAKAELSPQVRTIVTAANDCSSRAAGACHCWRCLCCMTKQNLLSVIFLVSLF